METYILCKYKTTGGAYQALPNETYEMRSAPFRLREMVAVHDGLIRVQNVNSWTSVERIQRHEGLDKRKGPAAIIRYIEARMESRAIFKGVKGGWLCVKVFVWV